AAAPPPTAAARNEAATATYFASVRNDPSLLLAFLARMPKGGDLHNHLSGAIYAESYLRWAARDGLCLAAATLSIVSGRCDAAAGRPPIADVARNNTVFNQAIDAMSMRHWDRSLNGHDHFFATFGKFGAASGNTGDMLAEVVARAAAENVSYLELMLTADGGAGAARGMAAGWDPDLTRLRDKLLAAGFRDAVVTAARARLDRAEASEREMLKCGLAQADAGCRVTVRYICQVARASAPESVFAQMLAGFEIASADPRFVSLNLVQAEDDPVAVRDFSLQMSMVDLLHAFYPRVKLSLHAGELTGGLVPPEILRFHIRDSLRLGHASRIGHGTGVMYEDDPIGLLREMASKKVLVEVALSSSDLILGVSGSRHPLRAYLKFGVPVALVTDDAGVSRSTLTLEYKRAVEDQGVDYRTLKRMARNSIFYSFADDATRSRLLTALDADFRRFEAPPPGAGSSD
ncbi:MAG: adenosine deaminase family protein, partial [Vicinamibacterales bacterium]